MEVQWKPATTGAKSREDPLLQEYLATLGGAAYMEVPVGENKRPGTRRIIDAVRIPEPWAEARDQASAGASSGKWKFGNGSAQKKFWDFCASREWIEVVEVKDQLGAVVIGQAYTGKFLLENHIEPKKTNVKAVVVCREGPDQRLAKGLLQVCQALDVTVWTVDLGAAQNKAKLFQDGGNGSRSALQVWKSACQEAAPARVELPAIELSGRRKRPTRGVIGKLIVAKLLLDMAHSGLGLRLVINDCIDQGNVSLLKVCEQLGIEVRMLKGFEESGDDSDDAEAEQPHVGNH
ncbi:MAG: hypothetical protein ACLQOO_25625 [Terriglobia bacterium]